LGEVNVFKNKTMVDTRDDLRIIYFLIKKDKVVYVGQSKAGLSRVYSHITANKKDFDSFSYIHISNNEDLDLLEADYIIKFDPIYNLKIHGNKYYKSLDSIKKILNIGKVDLNKIIRYKGIKPVFSGLYDIRDFPCEFEL
jgi:hypothetical protein